MGSNFSAPFETAAANPVMIDQGAACAAVLGGVAGERHFSPKEIARLWGLSETKIRRLFENEPGVMRIGEPSRRVGRKLKRSYYSMRVPASVALRVHRRLTAGGRKG